MKVGKTCAKEERRDIISLNLRRLVVFLAGILKGGVLKKQHLFPGIYLNTGNIFLNEFWVGAFRRGVFLEPNVKTPAGETPAGETSCLLL